MPAGILTVTNQHAPTGIALRHVTGKCRRLPVGILTVTSQHAPAGIALRHVNWKVTSKAVRPAAA